MQQNSTTPWNKKVNNIYNNIQHNNLSIKQED